jgi:alpha-galactosidase
MHRYILGVYTLYDKLLERHPNLLIESCASGGGRFDPGMLYYAPQTWTSDDSDAIERLKIQYGTSMVYPVSSIGAHVSAVPNHQVGRITPLDTRANVAFFGVFGYELDPNKLTEEEMQEIKEQIKYYKRNRELLLFGEFTRLASPFEENETMWMVKTKDKEQAIVAWFQVLSIPNDGYQRVRVPGLDPSALYEIEENGLQYTGSELENIGIVLTPPIRGELGFDDTAIMNKRDFDSKIFTLRKVK